MHQPDRCPAIVQRTFPLSIPVNEGKDGGSLPNNVEDACHCSELKKISLPSSKRMMSGPGLLFAQLRNCCSAASTDQIVQGTLAIHYCSKLDEIKIAAAAECNRNSIDIHSPAKVCSAAITLFDQYNDVDASSGFGKVTDCHMSPFF